MVRRSLIFVWGNPPTPGARWRLGLFHFTRPPRNNRDIRRRLELGRHQLFRYHVLRVSLRGLLAWGAAAALAAYLSGAALVVRSLDARSPHNRVTYLDLVSPARWSGIDRLRGETMIADAKDALAAGRYSEGLGLLRAGLSRSPDNHEARLVLARVYVAIRLIHPALETLIDGLEHGYPGRPGIEMTGLLLVQSGRGVELPDLLLKARQLREKTSPPPDEEPSGWLEQRIIEALLAENRPDEAENFATRHLLPHQALRRETMIIARKRAGRLDEASRLAEEWSRDEPGDVRPIRQMVEIQKLLGDHDEMERAIARHKTLAPSAPEAWLLAITQNLAAGREQEAERHLDDLILRHGSRRGLYEHAARVFVEAGYEPGLRRLTRETKSRGLPDLMVRWGLVTVAETRRDWPLVLAELDPLLADIESLPRAQRERAVTLRLLARNCTEGGSGHAVALVGSIAGRTLTLDAYARVIDALVAVGHMDTAAKIVTLAEGPYPVAGLLAARRESIEKTLAAIPAPAPAPALAPLPGGVQEFERAFTRLTDAGDAPAALALIDRARREKPAWSLTEGARLDLLELPLRCRGDDPLRLRTLVRAVLGRNQMETGSLVEISRETHRDRPENARLILDEILRRDPANPRAIETRRALFPEASAPHEPHSTEERA